MVYNYSKCETSVNKTSSDIELVQTVLLLIREKYLF